MPLRVWAAGLAALLCLLALHNTAIAQLAHHPFAIGASEGAVGHPSGLGAWILGMESQMYLQLTNAIRATKAGWSGALLLVGLSFGYGVFHAAGPGHGKAVIAAYMVSNEVALRRGLLIAFAAAILQGVVATAIVGIAAFVFNATAARMTAASQAVELAGYGGIVVLGLMLMWRKGRAVWMAIRPVLPHVTLTPAVPDLAFNDLSPREPGKLSLLVALRLGARLGSSDFVRNDTGSVAPAFGRSRFRADDGSHEHDETCDCGHAHMPNPAAFAAGRFDWRAARLAVVSAGARPCSGAMVVLVFSLGQGIFAAGVGATFAMALGTAITTGALATSAVVAKDFTMRVSGSGSRAVVVGRLVEFGASACVLLIGLLLLAAALTGVHAKA